MLKSSLYEQYKEGKISKQEFLQKKAQYETEEKENNQKQEYSNVISNSFPTQNQSILEIKELNEDLSKFTGREENTI